MGGRRRCRLPRELVRARDRFRSWRRKREPGARIPGSLWGLAVKLAGVHGLHRTASALGLDYYSLKKRVEAADVRQQATEASTGVSTGVSTGAGFIELPAPFPVAKQCLFELDDGSGATMRVQLVGYDAADVVALSRSVWKAE